jgi:hypothetical protein
MTKAPERSGAFSASDADVTVGGSLSQLYHEGVIARLDRAIQYSRGGGD